MNLVEYVQQLNELIEKHPEAGMALVVTSSDDEGNSFHPVHYTPSFGHYAGFEWKTDAEVIEHFEEYKEQLPLNAVCLN